MEQAFTIASLVFHICWIGLIMVSFGRPVGWVLGIAVPYIGFPVTWAYIFRYWGEGKWLHRLLGVGYVLATIVVIVSGLSVMKGDASQDIPPSPVKAETENAGGMPSMADPAMIAAIEAEMHQQTLDANLTYFQSLTNDISGEWARIADNKLFALVEITKTDHLLTATRTTVDGRVPQGEIIWKADLSTGEFKVRVAEDGFKNPAWIHGAVTQLSTNAIVLLPMYEDESLRPFSDNNFLEMVYIPKPDNVE